MKKLYFLFLFALLPFFGKATHIVGGEFNIRFLSGYAYRISFTLYFDEVNGNPQAQDGRVKAYIFQKSNNAFMDTVFIPIKDFIAVPYTNSKCAVSDLKTRQLNYETDIELEPDRYNSPQGYYLIWERCCRNNVITNIRGPGGTGQTFYLEFPPSFVNGQKFINNSPLFAPMKGDYACVQDLFTMNFSAKDPDGDSLVYDLVSPLRGNSDSSSPSLVNNLRPFPQPYRRVTWANNFDSTIQIIGNPRLSIDRKTGKMTLRASIQGLFVFAVRVAEYRRGRKIGEVRREFQLKVRDCEANTRPEIVVANTLTGSNLIGTDTIFIKATNDRCVRLKVLDKQANSRISIRTFPLNFNDSQLKIDIFTSNGPKADTVYANLCLQKCSISSRANPFALDLVASDDGCSIPKSDTVRLYIVADPPPSIRPKISWTDTIPDGDTLYSEVGKAFQIPVLGLDSNMENITITYTYFNQKDSIITPEQPWILAPKMFAGKYSETLFLVPTCNTLLDQYIKLRAIIKNETCDTNLTDTAFVYLYINTPKPSQPFSNILGAISPIRIKRTKNINFTVQAYDSLGYPVRLEYIIKDTLGKTVAPPPGIVFSGAETRGIIEKPFIWNTSCQNIPNSTYDLFFIASSISQCKLRLYDTTKVRVSLVDNNHPPRIAFNAGSVKDLFSSGLNIAPDTSLFTLFPGQNMQFRLDGFDKDTNFIVMKALPQSFTFNQTEMRFPQASGTGNVSSVFTWNATCADVKNGRYAVWFVTEEVFCNQKLADTIKANFLVIDSAFRSFKIPNLITANNDSLNDAFELGKVLPPDNCETRFEKVEIYTRWGNKIFTEVDRNFKWKPDQIPPGTYFYLLKFTHKTFKGWLEVTN